MTLDRFKQECPGLAGSLGRLFGKEVTAQLAHDYCHAADLGGNAELGVAREEGVSFNPRVARVVSLVIQNCDTVSPRVLQVAAYSSVPLDVEVPLEFADDIAVVRAADPSSPEWAACIALVLMLDTVRHLHMTDISIHERKEILTRVESSPPLISDCGSLENLRLKVIHGIEMQWRRINVDAEE